MEESHKTAGKIFNMLDNIIPGGTLNDLDRSVISNRGLYLTRISLDGLNDMHEYSKDKRLYRYFEFEPFKSIDETRAYLQKLIDRVNEAINKRKCMYWFIRLIKTDKIIGSIGLVDIDISRGSAAWGYAISPEYWGQGYILEAQMLVVEYFFEKLKMNRLWGVTTVDNEQTISSVLAAGFKKEGVLREYYKFANGERKDGYIYSMLAKDYFGSKKEKNDKKTTISLSLDALLNIMASTLGVDKSSINMDTDMADVSEWDSLSHVMLIVQIEKETGFKFKPSEIARATSIKSILETVNG